MAGDAEADHQAQADEPRGSRLEIPMAIAIGIVSLATAVAAWRASDLSSRAGDAERQGMIESVQEQSLANSDWQLVLEQAAQAKRYFAAEAEAAALEAGGDEVGRAQAAALRQYLLPSLALLGGPLVADETYRKADGSLDLERRFADEHAQTLRTDPPDPQAAFALADRIHAQHRWHVVGMVFLAASLFWLALAEITRDRTRTLTLILGLAVFAAGVIWFTGVELVSWIVAVVAP